MLGLAFSSLVSWWRSHRTPERARARRQGRQLRGPELLTPRAFTRRLRADGVGWMQGRSRGFLVRSTGLGARPSHGRNESLPRDGQHGPRGNPRSSVSSCCRCRRGARPRSSTTRRSNTHAVLRPGPRRRDSESPRSPDAVGRRRTSSASTPRRSRSQNSLTLVLWPPQRAGRRNCVTARSAIRRP